MGLQAGQGCISGKICCVINKPKDKQEAVTLENNFLILMQCYKTFWKCCTYTQQKKNHNKLICSSLLLLRLFFGTVYHTNIHTYAVSNYFQTIAGQIYPAQHNLMGCTGSNSDFSQLYWMWTQKYLKDLVSEWVPNLSTISSDHFTTSNGVTPWIV